MDIVRAAHRNVPSLPHSPRRQVRRAVSRTLVAAAGACASGLIGILAGALPAPAAGTAAPAPEDAAPRWIWLGAEDEAAATAVFRKEFSLPGPVEDASVAGACDNSMTVFVNGRRVLSSGTWEVPVRADVAEHLNEGRNAIAVEARNEGGPAGLLLRLELRAADGERRRVGTNASWRAAREAEEGWRAPGFDDADWSAATELAPLGEGPWAEEVTAASLEGATAPRPPQATPVDRFTTLPGFRVELLYSVPKEEQGSWVSLAVGPEGRLIASAQYGGLYRITPPPVGSSEEALVEPLDVDIGGAHGLLWAFDSLYVVRGEGDQGLYRVTDSDGDGELDRVRRLRKLQGGGEHGPHAVVLSPDGEGLYVCGGNHSKIPDPESSVVPRVWQEDLLLPRQWDASGHARGILAPGGWIARTDPEGSSWELVSNGYRNEYDITFNALGDLFTFDADMEWDVGTPWYRPTRVNHATSGSEFGWRSGTGKWPEYYPDSLGSVVDIGPGSPTGLVFGYGARFPERYQRALFICDWSYGKMYAVHLEPDGSTWKGEAELFLQASPLPLTDLVIHPGDGAMYFAIGGRRTQSGLYRVTHEDAPQPRKPRLASTPERELRRRLERLHSGDHPEAVETAWPHLGHPDRAVRFAARVAVEHRPVEEWAARALEERRPLASIEAVIALARHGDASQRDAALDALARIEPRSLGERHRLALLRATQLVLIRLGRPEPGRAARLARRLDALYPADSYDMNRELSQLLIYLEHEDAVAKTLDLLLDAPTQEEQIWYALVLRTAKTGWTPETRRAYFGWFGRAASYRGGHSFQGFIRNIKREAVETLTDAERERYADVLEEAPVEDPLAELPQPEGPGRDWTVDGVVALAEQGLDGGRDFTKGKDMFAATRCFACHRFAGRGGSVGPDLTGVSGRFSVRDLTESILEPSKEVSDQYQATVFELKNGIPITGRVVNLSGDRLSVNTDMFDPNKLASVPRNQIVRMYPSETSMMPEGLIDRLNGDEVLDLLAYLLSGGDPDHPMFGEREGDGATASGR